jgi:flagellin
LIRAFHTDQPTKTGQGWSEQPKKIKEDSIMALRINTNIAAINAHRQLLGTEQAMGKNMARLSSGYRINSAADDAAGLSVANRLRVEVRSLTVASRNVSEGKAMLNVAEGASNQIEAIIERIKELATQSASDNAALDRDKIDAEAQALMSEIDRIAQDTKYQGAQLVTGNFGASHDFAGVTGVDITGINIGGAAAGDYTFAADATGITLTNADTGVSQLIAAADIADGVQTLNFNALGVKVTTNGSFDASAYDLDTATFTVTAGAGVFQVGSGNVGGQDSINVTLGDLTTGATGLNLTGLDLGTRANAQTALDTIDTAINLIGTTLGDMGAAINRMDYTYANLQVSIENFQSSQSVIRDVDMADEMVAYTKNQILLQAGTAMLAQANTSSQVILSLFR